MWKLLIEQPGSFGRAIKDIIDVMCVIINFIKDILCQIIKNWTVPVLRKIADAVGKIPLIGSAPSRAIDTVADGLEAIADTVLCTPMQCLRAFDDAEESGDGALPVPTRCWATYITFYGDTDRLSCSIRIQPIRLSSASRRCCSSILSCLSLHDLHSISLALWL